MYNMISIPLLGLADPQFPLALPDVSKVRTVELLLKYRADPEARAKGLHSPLMMVRKEPETWRDEP